MKKALVSVLRLTMLVGVLVLLPFISKGPEAQFAHLCVTFFTDTLDCPSCGCTNTGTSFPNDIVTQNQSTGVFSIQDTPYSCGAPVSGCGTVACSGTYPQAVFDSSCCIAQGSTCASNEPCCPGLVCIGGTCGTRPASPVILDLDGNGFDLTSAAGGVLFDIAETGHPIQMGWTAPGAKNAFLCLPDPDGKCDDGKDLFGNFTPQPPSNDPNGFLALAVYDQPANGGNGDGIIDSRDAIYPHLRLWIDVNHDGISQPEELHTLPSLGVNSISLKYKESRKTDQYGNQFRYRARVNGEESQDVGKNAYDVFFATP